MKQQQTVRYNFGRDDEDAEDCMWLDWLAALIVWSGGDPIRESFARHDKFIEMRFYHQLEINTENFTFDSLDANMSLKVVRESFLFSRAPD